MEKYMIHALLDFYETVEVGNIYADCKIDDYAVGQEKRAYTRWGVPATSKRRGLIQIKIELFL